MSLSCGRTYVRAVSLPSGSGRPRTIAAATELVMGKLDRRPAAIVRGLSLPEGSETARTYVRPHDKDMFR